ncbi:rCG24934, isoform CRA_b [Rattus norvegicus]|uniref:RCG24934, isoform CRA_b n=1 Tax=Rattus norvegicus TaxID=10116 RepID=A6KLR8_RAT|nr:rCG24934, isoform CRA_b [Rattus norvegicus]
MCPGVTGILKIPLLDV